MRHRSTAVAYTIQPHLLPLFLLLLLTTAALTYYQSVSLSFTEGRLAAPLDDAWIHFQFARNLSQGHGFSYNPGEPQPGSTAPLWTMMLAGVGLFTEQFLALAIGLSALFLLATVWLTYGLTADISQSRAAGFLAGAGVALAGRLLWAGLAGMETTAFAALSVLAIWAYRSHGLRPWPTLFFALASQLRPEGHALFGLALLLWLQQTGAWRPAQWGTAVKQLLGPAAIYVGINLPYALFSLSITGQPLPNTFYAKMSSSQFFSWRTLQDTLWLHWSDNPASCLLLLLGLWPTWRRERLTAVWFLALPLLTAVIIEQTWHHGRYTMPLIPMQMVLAAVGCHWLWQQVGHKKQRQLLFALTALLLFWGASWQFLPWARMLGQNSQEILDIDVALGEWLAQHTPTDALIAVDDIGAITFLSQRRIVDMNGLVSPEMWPAVTQPMGLARDIRLTHLLSQAQPDYVVAFPLWHWPLTQNRAVLEPIHQVTTTSHTIIFQPEAFVYKPTWPYVADVSPTTAVDATFADAVQLVGYDWQQTDTAVGIHLYWRSLAATATDYDVFMHLLDENGQIVAQMDEQPLQGLTPTSFWQVGDTVRHPLWLFLAEPLLPGQYEVRVGLYVHQTGQRATAVGANAIQDQVQLLTFAHE